MTYLPGTTGDDRLIGSESDDVLDSLAGNDTLSGGNGNDTYRITGTGTKYIDDVVGVDTLDASGAASGATIDLTPGGNTTRIDGSTVILARPASTGPIDVFLLQDLSGSYGDDIATLRGLVPDLVSSLQSGGRDVAFGVGAFIDKPVSPFGVTGDYVYQTSLALTTDGSAFQTAVNGLTIGNGFDAPEAQIEALLQVAQRAATSEVGFRTGSLRTVVIATDAPYHHAGDGATAGITTPNNGDGVVDSGED